MEEISESPQYVEELKLLKAKNNQQARIVPNRDEPAVIEVNQHDVIEVNQHDVTAGDVNHLQSLSTRIRQSLTSAQ